jgi:cysteine desulfurase
VRLNDLRAAVEQDPETVSFVSLMMANNEVGTLQPVREVAALAHEHDIPVHTDAVQAVGQVPVDFADLGADAMTISAHKIGGPYGIGALVVRKETKLVPIVHGGGQERDVRSGTLDTPATAGFAVALEHAISCQPEAAARLIGLRDELVKGVLATVPGALLSGDPVGRLPGNAHLSFSGCEGDSLLLLLDARGIEVSTGSACNSGVAEPSHVLLAMGYDDQRARGSLRFTLGRTSTRADVDAVLENIGPVVERAMSAGLQNVGRNN